jgi:hypothetical protein
VVVLGGYWRRPSRQPGTLALPQERGPLQIECRPDALFDPRGDQVVYIDVIPRENWGKVMIKDFRDVGLLKIDEVLRCLCFEGDLERWRIPADSLVSADVASYRAGGQPEGQENPEIMYTTIIKARVGEMIWEAAIRKCHVEFKPRNNRLRESNAIAIRDQIRALRPGTQR